MLCDTINDVTPYHEALRGFLAAFRFAGGLAFLSALPRDRSIAAANASLRPGGSGTPPRFKISLQFIPHARIDVQGVQGAPKASDSNGLDPGHGGWTR